MKNVYTTEVSYENLAGEEKTQTLHFHITPREFADWMIDNMEEATRMEAVFRDLAKLDESKQATPETLMEIMKVIRLLAELSYGVPSVDGEAFTRPNRGYKFTESAAYDAFRIRLFESMDELEKFANTIMNPKVIEEFTKKLPKKPSALDQDFSDMGDDEFKEMTPEQMKAKYKELLAAKGGHNTKSE